MGELITLAADHVAAETVVTALEQILKNNAGDVELTDLRAIADLQNVFQVKYVQNPDCDYSTKVDTEVDISQLIQIARQELIRRGLKA